MTKALRVDPLGGASGDMFLAALVDLGADFQKIEEDLQSLFSEEKFKIIAGQEVNRGFSGIRLKVRLEKDGEWVAPEESHHGHSKDVSHHSHHHQDDKGHNHSHHHHGDLDDGHSHHHHRDLKEIRKMIVQSGLPSRVKERAVAVFEVLAEAEGKVHGKDPEDVHFHEVGAVDSIVDIVGSCLALDQLNIDEIYVTSIGLAQGSVKCAHGILPLPAPATQLILEGCALVYHEESRELCTPTGASLLKALGKFSPPSGIWRSVSVGMGISHRTPKKAPPFLRMTLLEQENQNEGLDRDEIVRLSFDIDDMPPEYLAPVTSELMEMGALDVSCTSLSMKKGRVGTEVRILGPVSLKSDLMEKVFKDTSTFGLRVETVERAILPREMTEVESQWGKVRVKRSLSDAFPKEHIEMEDVLEISRHHGVSVSSVLDSVRQSQLKG